MQEGSGNSDSLFLTAREGISQLSDFRIVALRQSRDKLVNRSLFGSFYDFLPVTVLSGEADVDEILAEFNEALAANGLQTLLDAANNQYQEFLETKEK